MGPPGGTTLPARRRLETYQFSRYLLKLPSGNDQPLGDVNHSPRFWYFRGDRMILFGRKLTKSLKNGLDNIMLVKSRNLWGN